MTFAFGFCELLWAFEGPTYTDNTYVYYYGVAIGGWFWGLVVVADGKGTYGKQA